MRNRGLVVGVLVTGFLMSGAVAVGLFLLLRPTPGVSHPSDAALVPDPIQLLPLEPPREDDDEAADGGGDADRDATSPPHGSEHASHARDGGHEPARDASRGVVRASNLKIRSVTNEHLCVGFSGHRQGLQLFPCRSMKDQRWTILEDAEGALSIQSAEGPCVHFGRSRLEIEPCDAANARFRHGDDRHFRELSTGMCMTALKLESKGRIVLEACDAANPAQTWGVAR